MTRTFLLLFCLSLACQGFCQQGSPEEIKSLGEKILEVALKIAAVPAALLGASCRPEDVAGVLGPFPVDIAVEDFRKLSPVTQFALKHRRDLPSSYLPVDPVRFKNAGYHAEIGVMLEGLVTDQHASEDGDVTFRIAGIECEITPEDQAAGVKPPQNGQQVRVFGWSYFDLLDGPASEQWEVHPVSKIEVVAPAVS